MEYSDLEDENKRLKAKLDKINTNKKEKWDKRAGFAKKVSSSFLGRNLKQSITNFFTELEEKRSVSKNTVSDLLTAIFMRVTRIGVFLIITTLLPTLFILFQVYLLKTQNNLIEGQNIRLEQQTYLQEAERRSNMMLVLDQTVQQVTAEGYRNGGKISAASRTRLIALSKILKPYKYLNERDSLTPNPVSPERGYLLLSLLESNIPMNAKFDEKKGSLLKNINFQYAELTNSEISDENLKEINLDFANLDGSNLIKIDIKKSSFKNASLVKTNFSSCNIRNGTKFNNAILKKADFSEVSFEKNVDFTNATIIGAKFGGAEVAPGWMEQMEKELDDKNFSYLEDHYRVKVNKGKGIVVAK